MVGATRPISTSVIIEDVAVPIEHLADATVDVRMITETNSLEGSTNFQEEWI